MQVDISSRNMKSLFKPNTPMRERANLAALALFLLFLFFLGGGSRPDLQSSIVLRPIAAVFGLYAVVMMNRDNLRSIKVPLLVLGGLALWIVIQLVPLPQSLWAHSPGYQLVPEIQEAAGLGDLWRPLSRDPARTWNSLYAICVPIVGVLLFSLQPSRSYAPVLLTIMSLSLLSAGWGVMQVASDPNGPLYLYRITNNGMLVGLFANRNHQGLLLAMLIVMLAHFGSQKSGEGHLISPIRMWMSALGCIVTLSLVLLTGSRASLALSVVGMMVAIILFYLAMAKQTPAPARARKNSKFPFLAKPNAQKTVAISLGAAAAFILGVFYYASRSSGLERLVDDSIAFELRTQIGPVLLQMARDHFPFGSGFGSFQHVYTQYEPQNMLRVNYVNNAHNDWMQVLIEGGLPAALIICSGLMYLGIIVVRLGARRTLLFQGSWTRLSTIILCLSAVIFAIAASLLDYPLRTPTLATVVAIYTAMLTQISRSFLDDAGRKL